MADAYREIDAVNISTLKRMAVSPMQYVHDLAHPPDATTTMDRGNVSHILSLQPERARDLVAVFNGVRRAGKEWDRFQEENANKLIVRADEYADSETAAAAVRSHVLVSQYLDAGEAEKVLTWTDKETGLKCKSRLDWLSHSFPAILDLKFTNNIDARLFGMTAARLGYHLQAAFYTIAAAASGLGDLEFKIVAVQADPPHDVVVFHVDEDAMWAGEQECRRLLRMVAECRASGRWPGRYQGEQVLRLPSWAYGETTDDDDATGLDLEWSQAKEAV